MFMDCYVQGLNGRQAAWAARCKEARAREHNSMYMLATTMVLVRELHGTKPQSRNKRLRYNLDIVKDISL